MRPLKIKDRCTKKKLKKCEEVARTYDKIQTAYYISRDGIKDYQRNNRPLTLGGQVSSMSGSSSMVEAHRTESG